MITFDQWRGDWGNPLKPVIQLESFDHLAKNGWSAERCYTSSPQCVPARLSWITGLAPSQLGVTKNIPVDLPKDSPSIIRELKEKGWITGLVGKTHWSNHNVKSDLENNRQRLKGLGFQKTIEIAGPRALQIVECALTRDWRQKGIYQKQIEDLKRRYRNGRNREAWEVRESVLPNNLYPDIWVADRALEMLESMPTNRPWLLWISFVGPHEPFDTPKPWKGYYKKEDLPDTINNDGWIDRLPESTELKKIKRLWDGKLLKKDIEALRNDYADHLKLLDSQVRRIINACEGRKDSDAIATVLTADHGEMLGDHDILYKSTFLEGSVRVPFIYKPPTKEGTVKYMTERNAINVTKLLKFITKNLSKGGSIYKVNNWCRKQRGAIVEFGEEIMFIRNGNKLVYNQNKKLIWRTNIKIDPSETMNMIESSASQKEIDQEIKDIDRWAKKHMQKRESNQWVKLNLQKPD